MYYVGHADTIFQNTYRKTSQLQIQSLLLVVEKMLEIVGSYYRRISKDILYPFELLSYGLVCKGNNK